MLDINGKLTNIPLQISGLAKITNRNAEFVFINQTVDVCKFFEDTGPTALMKIVFDEMTKKGLNIKSCPLQPGIYSSRGFHVNDNKFPPIVPMGRVYVKVDYLTGEEGNFTHLVGIEVRATIKNTILKSLRIKG